MNKLKANTKSTYSFLALLCLSGSSFAAVIYHEGFEDGLAVDAAFSGVGWEAVAANGTTLTNSTANPARIVNATGGFSGARRNYVGNNTTSNLWFTTDEVNLDQSLYLNDLEVSFIHRESDTESGDGFRVGFKIGSSWYIEDTLVSASTTETTSNRSLSSLNFITWAGAPANDSTAWTAPSLGGGTTLPAGTITDMGLMVVNNDNNDSFRFDDVTISGTPVPEPSATALLALGGLGLVLRRRK